MRAITIFSLAAAAALLARPVEAQAQDAEYAQTLYDRGDYAGAYELAEVLCRHADRQACDIVETLTTTPGKPAYDPADYVRISSIACQQPDGAAMCGDASLVASGGAEGLTHYRNWALVGVPGRRGCALGEAKSCYAMSQLLTHKSSPYRNLASAIPFSRKACEADILPGCFDLMMVVQELPDPALGQYADEYLLAFDRACRLGTTQACSEVPRARRMKERAARYGAANAVHMLYVDNGIDVGNWGGSVIHAIEEARTPVVIDYAVGKVAAAGQMAYVRQQDLPVIVRMLGTGTSAQAARNEMSRRAAMAARAAPAPARADRTIYTDPGAGGARSGYTRCTASNGNSGKQYWYYGFDNKVNYGPCL